MIEAEDSGAVGSTPVQWGPIAELLAAARTLLSMILAVMGPTVPCSVYVGGPESEVRTVVSYGASGMWRCCSFPKWTLTNIYQARIDTFSPMFCSNSNQ